MTENKELEFWERRYKRGYGSGAGSKGSPAAWKWAAIENEIPNMDDVIDVGCGELTFWKGRECKNYIGIDVSPTALNLARHKRPDWTYICQDASVRIDDLSAEVVMCMSTLQHIMTDDKFIKILQNLCYYSKKWIVIHNRPPNPKMLDSGKCTNGEYQYFRQLEDYMHLFEGFELVAKYENEKHRHYGIIYIFKKVEQ